MSTTWPTSGSSNTFSWSKSTKMPFHGWKHGITISSRFEMATNKLRRKCFFFSMVEDGPRGLNSPHQNRQGGQDSLEGGELSLYGVDWEDMENGRLMAHHRCYNPTPLDNPFGTAPPSLSEVECTSPNCPLSAEGVRQLDYYLSQVMDINSQCMLVWRAVWAQALDICRQIP